jgi:hypothetical protein
VTVSLVTSIGQLLPESEIVETLAPAGLTGWKLWGATTKPNKANIVAAFDSFDVLNRLLETGLTVTP